MKTRMETTGARMTVLVAVALLGAGSGAVLACDSSTPAPTLTAPASGSFLALPVTFQWSALAGAPGYYLQVSQDHGFGNPLAAIPTNNTSVTLHSLPGGVVLYWRVAVIQEDWASDAAAGTVRAACWRENLGPWSDVWTVVVPDPNLAAPALSAPANGATLPLPVTCAWSAVTGAVAYQLQVATDSGFANVVFSHGTQQTSLAPSGLPSSGSLFWRVRALAAPPQACSASVSPAVHAACDGDGDGDGGWQPPLLIGPWSAVWSFTIGAPLAAPTLVLPEDNATDVLADPTLQWQPVPGADGYNLEVATDEAFANLVADDATGDTSKHIYHLALDTPYYWRVQATAGTQDGPWSDVWQFTTSSTPPAPPAPVLTAPTLTAPSNGSTVTPPVLFSWTPVAGAKGYVVQFSPDPTFLHVTLNWNTRGTSLNLPSLPISLPGVSLYWRVQAEVGAYYGPWSSIWSFTLSTPAPATLAAPTLSTPTTGATVTPPITFSWSAVTGAQGYLAQFSTDPTFGSVTLSWAAQSTSLTLKSLPVAIPGVTLYWRVQAVASGTQGPWSGPGSFTLTSTAPSASSLVAPVLLAPAGAATVTPPVTFSWNSVSGATGYLVQFSVDPAFATATLNWTTTATSLKLPSLPISVPGVKLYWRVQAVAGSSGGHWSVVRGFTLSNSVTPPGLGAPTLTAPAAGAALAYPATFTWSAVSGATDYTVEIAADTSFATTLATTTTGTSATFSSLPLGAPGGTLYWRVQAVGAAAGPWSKVGSFKLPSGPAPTLTAPALLSPVNAATGVAPSPLLVWEPVDGATGYTVLVATDSAFGSVVFTGTPTENLLQLGAQTAGQTYYWRVRAHAGSVVGGWSAAGSFTVAPATPTLAVPTLLTPAAGSGQTVPLTLTWTAVTGAQSYMVEFAQSNTFATVLAFTPTTNSLTLSSLPISLPGMTVYWRVQALAPGLASNWTAAQSFSFSG